MTWKVHIADKPSVTVSFRRRELLLGVAGVLAGVLTGQLALPPLTTGSWVLVKAFDDGEPWELYVSRDGLYAWSHGFGDPNVQPMKLEGGLGVPINKGQPPATEYEFDFS